MYCNELGQYRERYDCAVSETAKTKTNKNVIFRHEKQRQLDYLKTVNSFSTLRVNLTFHMNLTKQRVQAFGAVLVDDNTRNAVRIIVILLCTCMEVKL